MSFAMIDELVDRVRQNSYLKSTLALLEWDQQTKLPRRANAFRAEQVTFLAGELHTRQIDPRIGELLNELSTSDLVQDPTSDHGATVLQLKREYEQKIKLTTSLVQAIARACATGQRVWLDARAENNFQKFLPAVSEIFKLKQEQADALGYDDCRYDALLDEYEPFAKTREVTNVLNSLKDELVPLVASIKESGRQPDVDILRRDFPIESQKVFVREASSKIGFNYDRGRLDLTHHPFCTELGPNDVRITTRYDNSFFSPAFFGTLHEAGHGIYEQGLRSEFYGLPAGQYCSLDIHESQSRLWENLVGRSASFWTYFYPRAQELFASLAKVSRNQFVAAVNHVAPTLIRVEADETTYNLHIIIRFQLEQAVIDGELATADLPTAWNELYEQFLGIKPDTDSLGVIQDIHWAAGLIGYFPTYSLGNLYASQFFEAATEKLGDLDAMFERGDFTPLRKWLNREIHERGKCLTAPNLGKEVTGKALSHDALMTHLRRKLEPIYAL